MTCQPELVTGYVDGALAEEDRAAVEAHLAECTSCREQADEERALRERLRGLATPALPGGLPTRVRRGLAAERRVSVLRLLLPLAAVAALAVVAARRSPPILAWELARDHDHCFSRAALPAQVSSEEPETVMRWFEAGGTRVPVLPAAVGGHELLGARRCWMPDLTHAAHVYYGGGKGGEPVSLFVVARGVGNERPLRLELRGHVVRLARVGDMTVGLVGDHEEELEVFARAFAITRASLDDVPLDANGSGTRLNAASADRAARAHLP